MVKSWYPILKCKLSFGLCDNLAKVVNYIADTYNFGSNYNKGKLFEFIYESEDKILNKMLKKDGHTMSLHAFNKREIQIFQE
ncbi:MAG: endonuclease [Clostridiaceae bacterium]|nr:endonuclease [Clostridiaceae bacterium]